MSNDLLEQVLRMARNHGAQHRALDMMQPGVRLGNDDGNTPLLWVTALGLDVYRVETALHAYYANVDILDSLSARDAYTMAHGFVHGLGFACPQQV